MSMPALLSHFGLTAARYVTTSGEIVFDGVTKANGGYSHATLGAVTAVTPHTFHAGVPDEDEPDDPLDTDTAWWNDPDEIGRHIDAMTTSFPTFTYVPATDDVPPCWSGQINTGRGRFTVAIGLRHDRGLPAVRVINGPRLGITASRRWVPAPHLYCNGNLCVADRDDWRPEQHTAATVTAWAAHWLAAYTEWRITRHWPVEGVQARAS